MRVLTFIIFLSFYINIDAQETLFSNYEKKNLVELNPKLSSYQFNNTLFNTELKELLKFDEKQHQNKVWAFVFTGVGLVSAGASIQLLNKNQPLTDVFGIITASTSVLSFGTSIPFYFGHFKNKKKKREKLIFINNEFDKYKIN